MVNTDYRFRVNAYHSKGEHGFIARLLATSPPSIEELKLPEKTRNISLEPRGLVLVTGPTGSGKTTTLAAIINYINESRKANIVTMEDPIEILHKDKQSLVLQRELGLDTDSFETAMKAAMRQDPDVMLIGEMRDKETVKAALQAAETGHLVLSTLHTIDAEGTINRIIEFFEPHEQQQIRYSLADSLRAILSQRLIKNVRNERTAALEVLINNGRVSETIINPHNGEKITELILGGEHYGIQSFDRHLYSLIVEGEIDPYVALDNASNANDLALILRSGGIISG